MYYSFESSTLTETYLADVKNNASVVDASLSLSSLLSTTLPALGSSSLQTAGTLTTTTANSQYVTLPSVTTGSSGLSFAFWMRNNNSTGNNTIFDFANGQCSNNITMGTVGGLVYSNVINGTSVGTPVISAMANPWATNPYIANTIGITVSIGSDKAMQCVYGSNNLYYSTYNTSTSTWSDFTSYASGSVASGGVAQPCLSADGKRGIVIGKGSTSSGVYSFTWTGATPSTLTTIDSTSRDYYGADMTPDGNNVVISHAAAIYFTTYNGTSWSPLTKTLDTINSYGEGVGISADGSKIVFVTGINIYYAIWNGTNYGAGIQFASNTITIKNCRFSPDGNVIYFGYSNLISVAYSMWNGTTYSALINVSTSILPANANTYGLCVDMSNNLYVNSYSGFTAIYKLNFAFPTMNQLCNFYPTTLTTNAWNHCAWTISSAGVYTYYINGAVVYTSASGLLYPTAIARTSNFLCKSNNLPYAYWNGGLDDFRVYNRVLSAGEVSSLYTYNGVGGSVVSTVTPTLYLNGGAAVTGNAITYSPLAVANTYVGYGISPYNNYFNGKIDDFRYYGRVLCPMEMRVLYSYAYGKSTGMVGIKTTPTLGTVTVGTLTATTAPLIFPSSGTYSYVGINRTFAGATSTFIVNASSLVLSGSNYVWTDTVAFTSSPSVSYVITPYILGTPGSSQALTATIPVASAITSVLVYNAGIGVFDVSWIGGVGIGVTYTYDVSSSGAIVASGNYTTTALGTINPTRITLTDNSANTYTVIVKATNVVGTVVGIASALVTTASPQPLIVSSITGSGSYATNQIGSFSNSLITGNGIVSGTYAYNSKHYTGYAFGNTSNTYTITYKCSVECVISVLCVGGGGGGGKIIGGGGGAGGVSMKTVSIPVTSGTTTNTIVINIGTGGNGSVYNTSDATIGGTTTVTVTGVKTLYGGGGGTGASTDQGGSLAPSIYGGSSGGVGRQYTHLAAVTANSNYANPGGDGGGQSGVSSGGGGGAGTAGTSPPATNYNGVFNGSGLAGDGIKCNLGEINSFIPNPNPSNYSPFGTYYWGGGGGAGGNC